jgi:hypothetical protein
MPAGRSVATDCGNSVAVESSQVPIVQRVRDDSLLCLGSKPALRQRLT